MKFFPVILLFNAWFLSSEHLNGQTDKPKGNVASLSKYNIIDNEDNLQGFWKSSLPDAMGHNSNYEEGLFYNSKKVGVWYKRDYQRRIYEMDIYYDTSLSKVEHYTYYLNGQVKEHGFLALCAIGKKDTLHYTDPWTNKNQQIVWDSTLMKQGKWSFYNEKGVIESEGQYEKDKRKGMWSYYNREGKIINVENLQ